MESNESERYADNDMKNEIVKMISALTTRPR